MSGFVFGPQNTDQAEVIPAPEADDVVCDGWWPNINLTLLRGIVRLDTTVSTERLRDAVQNAMLDMGQELAAWRAEQEAAGHESLAEVPGRREAAGESDYVVRWRRGIYSIVGADLGERMMGQATSGPGEARAELHRLDIDVHLRNVRYAVRDFLGQPRIIAEAL